jgi:predicted Zn-dependent protease
MDDQETEIAAYREILKFAPRNFEARRRLGRVLTLTHDNEEAQELLMSCLREKPHDTRTLINLADWCHRNGQSAVASKYLATVLATRSDARERASALVLLGQIDIEQGEHDQAASHLREAVESDPTNVGAVYSLSQALSRAGRSDEANSYFERWERLQTAEKKLDAFRDAIIAHPDDPSLRSSIGEALLEKGEAKAGVNWLLSALFHDPKHAQTHRLLADHYERLGETELAARHRAIAEGTAEPTEFVKPNAVSSSSQPVSPARHPQ